MRVGSGRGQGPSPRRSFCRAGHGPRTRRRLGWKKGAAAEGLIQGLSLSPYKRGWRDIDQDCERFTSHRGRAGPTHTRTHTRSLAPTRHTSPTRHTRAQRPFQSAADLGPDCRARLASVEVCDLESGEGSGGGEGEGRGRGWEGPGKVRETNRLPCFQRHLCRPATAVPVLTG